VALAALGLPALVAPGQIPAAQTNANDRLTYLGVVGEGGVRLTELVSAMGLPKQTLGDMIDDLEVEKLVERVPDPEHGVIKRVRLAQRGRQWAAEVKKVADATQQRWAAALGKAKAKTLRSLLEELAAGLNGTPQD
jgi:DNA-binding MarR family transcriptional regulator